MSSLREKFSGSASWLAILGGVFFWTWQDQCMFGPTLSLIGGYQVAEDLQALLMAGSVVGLLAYAIANWRKGVGVWVPRSFMLAAFVGVLGCVFCGMSISFGLASLVDAGCLLTGVSIGVIIVLWGMVVIAQGMEKAILSLSAAWMLGLVTTPVFMAIPAEVRWWVAALLPVLSMTCYLVLADRQADERYAVSFTFSASENVAGGVRVMGLELPFALTVIVFCLAFGIIQAYEPYGLFAQDGGFFEDTLLARFLVASIILAVCAFRSLDRLARLFEVGLSFLIIGSVALLATLGHSDLVLIRAGRALTSAGYAFFDVLVWSLIAYYGRLKGAHPKRIVAGGMLFEQAGILCGILLGHGIGVGSAEGAVSAGSYALIGCVYLFVVCSFFVVRRYAELWPMFDAAPAFSSHAEQDLASLRQRSVDAVAQEHGLTGREAEVLAMLASGRDVPRIAEQLFISENTVKTHVRHIYEKCQFHSRQDLIDSIEHRSDA